MGGVRAFPAPEAQLWLQWPPVGREEGWALVLRKGLRTEGEFLGGLARSARRNTKREKLKYLFRDSRFAGLLKLAGGCLRVFVPRGVGPSCVAMEGAPARQVFEANLERALAPWLGQDPLIAEEGGPHQRCAGRGVGYDAL